MNSPRRILAVTHKELRQLRRDRLSFGMIVGIPVVQLLVFGYAINTNVRDLRAGVVDQAGTTASRNVIAAIAATQVARPLARASSPAELEEMLRTGAIDAGIVIPADYSRRVARREFPAVQILVDGTDTAVAGALQALARMPPPIDAPLLPQQDQVAAASDGAVGSDPAAGFLSILVLFNMEKRSAVSVVPALIGVILTMTMVLFTSIAIVRERERGTLELLITTPVRSVELMLGKIIPYVLIGATQLSIVLFLGSHLFAVPVRGSLVDLYLAGLAFITANLALGLLFSTIARTQFQSVQLAFFIFLPSILLSGFMFPFSGMPGIVQKLAEILPLTHFNRLSRGILVRGATLYELRHEVAPLGIFFIVVLALALARFRKRLD
ncbi:MAG: ABC transporter permease [Candidatus Schekmanbacteria bacterium]|nr:ABC transporter permease [Candidatus Schekmanbacteria bacterium]